MKKSYCYKFSVADIRIVEEDGLISEIFWAGTKKEDIIEEETELIKKVAQQISEFLNNQRRDFDFSYKISGSKFAQAVYQQIKLIKYGEVKTYKEIATLLSNPSGARAVGQACKKNKLLFVIPCHRVVASKKLGGFNGGIDIKQTLLEIEEGN